MNVAIEHRDDVFYPDKNNMMFPDKIYPEIKIKYNRVATENHIFDMVRSLFIKMNYDLPNLDTPEWNPLGHIITPGNTVLLKPNLVLDRNESGLGEDCLYTHPSIIVAMINYVWIALKGNGKIIVADAPVQQCNFENLIETSGLKKAIDFFRSSGVNIELIDLRGLVSKYDNGVLVQSVNQKNGIIVDLGEYSQHAKLSGDELKKIRITNYHPDELLKHHNKSKHEYCIAEEILNADVIVNMPKPKAHRKAGVTIALKNMVGINVRKEYLPHHRIGDKAHGGDEYLKNSVFLKMSGKFLDWKNTVDVSTGKTFYKMLLKSAKMFSYIDKKFVTKQTMREGSWYGNDTIWRTIIDLNKIVLYSDKEGILRDEPQRKMIILSDMIIVGEKEGPLMPSPKHCGVLAYSESAVCFDEAIATVMGFDTRKLPIFGNLRANDRYPLLQNLNEKCVIVSNNSNWNNRTYSEIDETHTLNIEPCKDWKGHIELGD